MRFSAQIIGVLLAAIIAGCVSGKVRVPASFKPKYDNKITNSLKSAAINGVLFQVSDSVFRDVPTRQVERCRKAEAPQWSEKFLELLESLDKNPQNYGKFHFVDIKRGDQSKAEISKDIDGLSYLNILYSKRETREKVGTATTIPCGEGASEYLGKDLVTTIIDWPTSDEINLVLKQAPAKSKIERFQFNTEFLVFLAERPTILKLNPEVAFERTFQGEFFLTTWLEKMAQDIHKSSELEYVNYWIKEIGSQSLQAHSIQFFSLNPESSLSYGLQVDTNGKFARKLNGFQEPSYLFMSYRQHNGEYVYTKLSELNTCLEGLMGIYKNPLGMGTTLDADENSFLSPGYSCKPESAE
jgi:hypothetical protein